MKWCRIHWPARDLFRIKSLGKKHAKKHKPKQRRRNKEVYGKLWQRGKVCRAMIVSVSTVPLLSCSFSMYIVALWLTTHLKLILYTDTDGDQDFLRSILYSVTWTKPTAYDCCCSSLRAPLATTQLLFVFAWVQFLVLLPLQVYSRKQ